jgi:hypothetical protein
LDCPLGFRRARPCQMPSSLQLGIALAVDFRA